MVHGGGHHHSSNTGGGGGFSGGSNWGGNHQHQHHQHNNNNDRSRGVNNNVVVIHDNSNPSSAAWYAGGPWWSTNPRYGYSRDSDYYSPNSNRSEARDEDDCRECCRVCCTQVLPSMCLCSACCRAAEAAESIIMNNANRDGTSSVPYESIGEDAASSNPLCQGFCFSLAVFIALLLFSALTKTWTLNAGETRHIMIPILNSRIQVRSDTGGVRVYALAGSCPSLTGQIIPLDDERTLSLGVDDYQYDYFFLNKGSQITVDLIQVKGATNFFLMQGESMLQQIEGEPNEGEDDFHKTALRQKYVAEGGFSQASLSYVTRSSDVFILVYENASTKAGRVSIHFKIDLTTYDLDGQTPVCDESMDSCYVPVSKHRQCVLTQAVSDSGDHTADETVTVEMSGTRCWLLILMYSLIPFLLGFIRLLSKQRQHNAVYQSVSAHESNPPPTAPHAGGGTAMASPSAPVEAQVVEEQRQQQQAYTVIPAENVIMVPMEK